VLLDLLLPQRCAVCALPGRPLCRVCLARLPPIRPPLCARCGAPRAWPAKVCRECEGRRLGFATARAAVIYDDSVRSLVSAWKERGLRRVADLAATLVAEAVARPEAEALVFVPPDPERGLKRGHHPPATLASRLGEAWQLPVLALLARTRSADRQRGLSTRDRRRNVRGAFAVRASPPARLALVDDVYTTGATVAEAARALRRAGAKRIDVVTFARAIRTG
jgi:ComF family protein